MFVRQDIGDCSGIRDSFFGRIAVACSGTKMQTVAWDRKFFRRGAGNARRKSKGRPYHAEK